VFRKVIDKARRSRRAGFTLIELMIVIVIIGLLASIGIANFMSLQKKARYASCITNQKHIHEGAVLYAMDNIVGTQTINVTVLTATELATPDIGECAASGHEDFDDYRIEFVAGKVASITCSILGIEHLYEP